MAFKVSGAAGLTWGGPPPGSTCTDRGVYVGV